MQTLLWGLYFVIALSVFVMGAGVAGLEYSFGDHSKRTLYLYLGISALIGVLWPLGFLLLLFGAVIELV